MLYLNNPKEAEAHLEDQPFSQRCCPTLPLPLPGSLFHNLCLSQEGLHPCISGSQFLRKLYHLRDGRCSHQQQMSLSPNTALKKKSKEEKVR